MFESSSSDSDKHSNLGAQNLKRSRRLLEHGEEGESLSLGSPRPEFPQPLSVPDSRSRVTGAHFLQDERKKQQSLSTAPSTVPRGPGGLGLHLTPGCWKAVWFFWGLLPGLFWVLGLQASGLTFLDCSPGSRLPGSFCLYSYKVQFPQHPGNRC